MVPSQLSHTLCRVGLAPINRNTRLAAVARRCYAQARDEKKRNNLPWLVLSIGLTVPAAMYLWRSGPEEVEHGLGPQRPLVKAREAAGEETQADRDPADVIKPAKSFTHESGSQTTKQQGLSNKETMNPYLYGSGKSEKAEGITDSSKLLGTVSPERGKK